MTSQKQPMRAAHSDGRSAARVSAGCWSINSSQASLFPRSVPVWSARALVALRLRPPIHRLGPFIDKSDQLFSCATRVCVVVLLPGFFCV